MTEQDLTRKIAARDELLFGERVASEVDKSVIVFANTSIARQDAITTGVAHVAIARRYIDVDAQLPNGPSMERLVDVARKCERQVADEVTVCLNGTCDVNSPTVRLNSLTVEHPDYLHTRDELKRQAAESSRELPKSVREQVARFDESASVCVVKPRYCSVMWL